MIALGSLITTLGWLWLLAAFAGPAFGLDRINFFPGIGLLIGGRALRAAGRRRESEEDLADLSDTPAPPPTPPSPSRPRPRPQAQPSTEETEATSAYAEALRSAAEDVLEEVEETSDEPSGVPGLSSAEMIARARRRWDRRS